MHASSRSRIGWFGGQTRTADGLSAGCRVWIGLALGLTLVTAGARASRASDRLDQSFADRVQPVLEEYCSACHANGMKKGNVSFDALASEDPRLHDTKLWWNVLRNVRAGMMPPAGKPRPTSEDLRALEDWIRFEGFGIDPRDPDPGRVTVHRLNRVEYRNTIHDLLGIEYDTGSEFPPDDSGHGFDNIGDVLTISPLLLEKYLAAARAIVTQVVPMSSGSPAETLITGRRFRRSGPEPAPSSRPASTVPTRPGSRSRVDSSLSLSYYEPARASYKFTAEHSGHYRLLVEVSANERFVDGVFDYNKCRLIFKDGDRELFQHEYGRQEGKSFHYEVHREWKAGPHELSFQVEPLTPNEKQVRSLTLRIQGVTVRGPMEPRRWVKPKNYARFFPRPVPASLADRRAYARELLGRFASRAYRRPASERTVDRLVALAESTYTEDGQTFEAGIAQAMTAVLASPEFLFREEGVDPTTGGGHYPLVDEYALASRLSYFLWSSMPDDELIRLASEHKLRENLVPQVKRMLADHRSSELIRQFVGQWLQVRDIDSIAINAFAVISRDRIPDPDADRRRARVRELIRKPPEQLTDKEQNELKELRTNFVRSRARFREFELSGDLRRAMRRETEMLFDYVLREDRRLVELIDCDYTFLNERLARAYGIEGVKGEEMRRVDLPPDSPRGGVLTQGTVLAVTSNPDRTSPVKRGLFILDNFLGTPPPPPPPDIPPLEQAGKRINGRPPTLRETLALHREAPLCNSCHNRMDPLGLAFEHFNALGRWRDFERGQPIDATGRLITGESFKDVQELKHLLANERRRDFYRCLSEKMLTYALGRGLDHLDVLAVDRLVERLEKEHGHASALILGIVESTPFQKRRPTSAMTLNQPGPAADQGGDRPKQPRTGS